MPSVDNARERRFEGDEELRLLRELRPIAGRSKIMIPLVQFAIETAGRQSELLALKWKDVDIDGRSILIRGKARADGKDRTKGTKGRADNQPKTRSVPLTQQAMAVLRDLAKNGVDGDSAVFQINNKVAQRCVSAACERAGIDDFSFHDLRHEATSRLAGRFMMHELMKITGHKTTRMLERYYHPRVEDLAKKLD
jgi:integrase